MIKRFSKIIVSAALLLSLVVPAAGIDANAATVPSSAEAYTYRGGYYYTGTEYGAPIVVTLDEAGDYVGNLHSSSDALKVYLVSSQKRNGTNKAYIGIWTKKAGTYTVSFSIYGSDGNVKEDKSVKVTVRYYSGNDSPVKSIKYAGKNIYSSSTTSDGTGFYDVLSTPKSGKFKVSLKKGYKLKSIQVGKQQKKKTSSGTDTELVYANKGIKNGSKVTLSKQPSEYSYSSKYSFTYNESRKSMCAYTSFRITYVNTKTKEEGTFTTSIGRLVNYVK